MTLEEIRENVEAEMATIEVEADVESTLKNLMYTAYETGIIPFKMHGDFVELIQLVKLAERLNDGIPRGLSV